MFRDGEHGYRIKGPVLVMGALPHLNVIAMKKIRWFWIEED
jgi:hypothetical protein